jgi:hypothetical protein
VNTIFSKKNLIGVEKKILLNQFFSHFVIDWLLIFVPQGQSFAQNDFLGKTKHVAGACSRFLDGSSKNMPTISTSVNSSGSSAPAEGHQPVGEQAPLLISTGHG